MTFTSNVIRAIRNIIGDRKRVTGVYSSGGSDTGGNIDTNLRWVDDLSLSPASIGTAFVNAGTAYPISGSAVPIVTSLGQSGIWVATGQ